MYQNTTTRQCNLEEARDTCATRSVVSAKDHIAEQQEVNSFNSFTSSSQIRKPSLAEEALYGPAGDFVRSVDPFTEADRVAVLINFLTAFGNVVGHRAYFKVGYTPHFLNLFTAQVGTISKGRKGTGWSVIGNTFQLIDRPWSETRITSGLS